VLLNKPMLVPEPARDPLAGHVGLVVEIDGHEFLHKTPLDGS
jgi:hypothetical protein